MIFGRKEDTSQLEEMLNLGKQFREDAQASPVPASMDILPTMPLTPFCAQPYGEKETYYFIEMKTNRSFAVCKAPFLIGALKDACDLFIQQDPEVQAVSRLHAVLVLKNGKAYLKDQSTNGTFLGELGMADKDFYRLPKDTEVEIRSGQVVRFAIYRYIFLKGALHD